jgi:hypothetical protein
MKARKVSVLLAGAGLYLALPYASAGELAVSPCPPQLVILSQLLSPEADADTENMVGNMEIHNRYPEVPLERISIFAGELSIKTSGVDLPSSERKLPDGGLTVYYDRFTPDIAETHDYWIVCNYFGSTVVLTQKIPKNVMRCEVKYTNDVTAQDYATIKCFDTPRKME